MACVVDGIESRPGLITDVVMARTGLRFTLSVIGLPDDTFVVAGFTLQEQYSSLFQLELELASANPAVEFGKVLDSDVTLTVWRDEEVQRTVSGIVVSMEQGDTGRHQTRYSLSVRPALWRATLERNSRIFQQQDLPAILETLLKKNGIQNYTFSLRYARSPREFCVQYQEDDVAFIQRMTAEEGVFYFFEHHGNQHTLVFSDDCAVLNEGPELPYHPQSDDEPGIHTLRRRESLRPSDVLLKDYTFKNPDWRAEYDDYGRGTQHQARRYLHYDYPGRYKNGVGKQFSRWRMEALRNDAYQGEGASNCAGLELGTDFTLTQHPHEAMNTRWQITGVSCTGRQPQALEEATGERGTTLVNQFTFIPREQTWRPLVLDKPRIDGAQIAIVTGPPGEEIYCDEHGRIRVRFLWDRSGRIDDTSSCWIRVSHPWAGQGWGSLAIPRIGHEVIIEFLNGDPDQPVVIGRTYHATNTPQGKLPGSKTQMSIRSKTHKGDGFNELRFDDAKDNEEVFVHAQKDMNTKILNDKTVDIEHDSRHHIKNDSHLRVDNEYKVYAGNDLSISTNAKLHIKTGDGIFCQAKNEIHIKSDMKLVIDAGSEITLQAAGHFIKIDAGGISSSPALSLGSGSPGKGSGWAGKYPDALQRKAEEIPLSSVPTDVKTPDGGLCITCLMGATLQGTPLLIRGEE
ncbi:type VI secretion system tip protein TssI/VgrG [Serratia silvae]